MDTILRLERVTRRFDSFTLQPLNLDLPGGVIMGLIGENGAGATLRFLGKSLMETRRISGRISA